jgi:hypothetical protein
MKTRVIVSVLTAGALALGSVSSFAYDGHGDRHGDRGQAAQNHAGRANTWQGAQQWQRGQQGEQWQQGQQWRASHERYEHRERDHRGYGWQQRGYVYQQPDYVYQPAYGYQQPYYGYDDSDAGANFVLGAIVGGVIGQALANGR